MTDLTDRMDAMRSRAAFACQRRKDVQLYFLLADCLAICEECERDNRTDELKAEALEYLRDGAGGRRYMEGAPDVYLIVGRYVFEREINRAACWRYTATLREAAKSQIASADLAQWLRENGGINALFKARDLAARSCKTKTLHLTSPVTVPKDGQFTLMLMRLPNGFFEVAA